jgi:hypothetical protein
MILLMKLLNDNFFTVSYVNINQQNVLWHRPQAGVAWRSITKQVTCIKYSFLQLIQTQNAQTLQLFTKIIKTEGIYKNAKQMAWV